MDIKKLSTFILSSLALLLSFSSAFAQENGMLQSKKVFSQYSFKRYTTQDGIPQMLIESLYQDSKGYLWVGTLSGFARFDGFSFASYMKGENENIVRFTENTMGDTTDFYALHYRRSHRILSVPDSVETMQLSEDEKIYNYYNSSLLPDGYGIFENEDETGRVLRKLISSGSEDTVLASSLLDKMDESRKPFWDRKNGRFFVPTDEGLYILSAFAEKNNPDIARVDKSDIHTVYEQNGIIYLIASDGLYRYADRQIVPLVGYNFDITGYGINVCSSKEGDLIIADAHTVCRFDEKRVEPLLSGINLVRQLLEDHEGNIWVATYQGLYNLFRLTFKNTFLEDDNDIIRSVACSGTHLWAGTLNGKLYSISENEFLSRQYPQMSPNSYFQPYPVKIGERIFMIESNGLISINGNIISRLPLPQERFSFLGKYKDRLLVGSRRSVLVVDIEGNILRIIDGLNGAFGAETDKLGRIWIGTVYGVFLEDGGQMRSVQYDSKDIKCSFVTSTSDGKVYLSSANRLFRTDGDSLVLVHKYGSLIRSILQTRDGHLVVAVVDGIYVYTPDGKNVSFYNKDNGYTGIEPLAAQMAEDENGNVSVASIDRLVSFNIRKLEYETVTPQFNFTAVSASQDNIAWESMNYENIKLGHKFKNIKISYIGLSFSATSSVKYRYRLEGFQNDWSNPISEREVVFNNLPPGKYRFQIKSYVGAEPIIGAEPYTIGFEIQHALWQNWWFIMAVSFMILSFIAFGMYFYFRKKNKQKMLSMERENKLNNLQIKSIRLTSIPHFNANILAGIEYYMLNRSLEEASLYLSKYSQFTNKTLTDVDKAARSLRDEIEYVELYLTLEKMRYGDDLTYAVNVDKGVDDSVLIPNMVLHTYCENAIKHGLRNKKGMGKIQISVSGSKGGITICVEDDGVGREAAARSGLKSTKKGLSILSQQIELYNQRNTKHISQEVVDLKDEEGKGCGTKFILNVPYSFNYF